MPAHLAWFLLLYWRLRLLFFFNLIARSIIDYKLIAFRAQLTLSPDVIGLANECVKYNFDVFDLLALLILRQLHYTIELLHHGTVDIFIVAWFSSRTLLDMRDDIPLLDSLPAWAHEFLLMQILVKNSLGFLEFKEALWCLLIMRVILLTRFKSLLIDTFFAVYSSIARGWCIVGAVHKLLKLLQIL